jgi:hypothetical protein
LGSGTGVVGLGMAAISRGQCATAVTDMDVELLHKNVALNAHHWMYGTRVFSPIVREVSWGQPIDDVSQLVERKSCVRPFTHHAQEVLEQRQCSRKPQEVLEQTECSRKPPPTVSPESPPCKQHRRRTIITGADIVYRPSLFRPLLQTLTELEARLHQLNDDTMQVDTWLACNSIRTHLPDFIELAKKLGFAVELLAVVELPSDHACHVEKLVIHPASDPAPVREGMVWILQIRRRPYAFAI